MPGATMRGRDGRAGRAGGVAGGPIWACAAHADAASCVSRTFSLGSAVVNTRCAYHASPFDTDDIATKAGGLARVLRGDERARGNAIHDGSVWDLNFGHL